ncbi:MULTISPECIES: fructosamine kinase family protein [unclassified Streptomyces]|uniref:fructosamine kinase family protein n=1 Tax=unclassified Streptomyces TaxID=2593676 RepID=UPI00224EBE8A|nr:MULTISPECIES: fructosamine kinase family protein [unclassified Streptomyces]MCX5055022.1 fructosamine kinase family protein [Streptomyces sp. NBC_00474]MCX5063373.1 fructosamine kinase family protein [Streptomyces sp. NBC_00452]MCX5251226.1 fructosamine kinase family protein [Streptomyces sp. NBC_00201]MCX5294851.1 fructosamine kinase family protein [Streptomyces sp. NBC_00183]
MSSPFTKDSDGDDGPGAAAARITGRSVRSERRLSGALAEVGLDGGQSVIVKRADAAGAVQAEAAGLRWLTDAGTVAVPNVHGHDARWLVTDLVPPGRPAAGSAVRFGRGLAALHAAGAPAFGAPPPGGPVEAYIGLAPMRNVPGADWPHWYAEQRVLPYLRGAVDRGTIRPAETAVVERVCERLPELAGPAEPPARLHGDLWNGNVLWGDDGEAWLIDPAAHGGHRETDLAMLHLFGCPHLEHVLDGYQRVAPLADGWADRIALHQLFPLLVHAVLFGRGFAEQALAAARAALA